MHICHKSCVLTTWHSCRKANVIPERCRRNVRCNCSAHLVASEKAQLYSCLQLKALHFRNEFEEDEGRVMRTAGSLEGMR